MPVFARSSASPMMAGAREELDPIYGYG